MSGHSKWSTIKRAKGIEDAKRSKEFSKIAKDIEIVTRLTENGDVNTNPNLKVHVDKAKSANMTKEKIQKAINRGLGIKESDDEITFFNTYEFYGPAGTQMLVDCETDNPNRTFSDIKLLGHKNGLKIANEGSISWAFETVAHISLGIYEMSQDEKEELQLETLELPGILDIKSKDGVLDVFVTKENFKEVYKELTSKNILSAELIKKTDTLVKLSSEEKESLAEIISNLEEMDEVQSIWVNFKDE